MKKSVKITLWVLFSIVALGVVLFLSADIIASTLVKKEVSKAFANIPDANAEVGNIYLNLISGSAIVKDITFSTHSLDIEEDESLTRAPGLAIHIPTLGVWNVDYYQLLRHRRLEIFAVSLDDPEVVVYLDEKDPASLLPTLPKDTTLEKAGLWLQSFCLRHLDINRFSVRLHSTSSPLVVKADTLSMECHDLAYNFADSVFSYNDSVYSLSLAAAKVALPDGLMDMEVHDLNTSNQGPLNLGYTRIRNIVSHTKMVEIMREQITWIDLELNSVTTSPLNPIHKALSQDYTLDEINADVRRMHVIRDARLAPKVPFGTPQEFLRTIPVTFAVKKVTSVTHKLDVELYTTAVNCGKLNLKGPMYATMTNVTNKPGAVWHNRAKAPFGDKGHVEASYDIHMDRKSSFDLSIHGKDLNLENMNPFIRPLVGITCAIHVKQLDADYSGDQTIAKGAFCMQYHGLDIKVHKEDNIPYKIVTKHADFFTSAANSLLPKSNPTSVDIHPRKYAVEWTRDVWSPYPLYLFGPCIDGIKKTMLPGLYVHKQIN